METTNIKLVSVHGLADQLKLSAAWLKGEAVAGRIPSLRAGRRVLLVDDVTTTGATLAFCATALKSAGARSVRALTFARED